MSEKVLACGSQLSWKRPTTTTTICHNVLQVIPAFYNVESLASTLARAAKGACMQFAACMMSHSPSIIQIGVLLVGNCPMEIVAP